MITSCQIHVKISDYVSVQTRICTYDTSLSIKLSRRLIMTYEMTTLRLYCGLEIFIIKLVIFIYIISLYQYLYGWTTMWHWKTVLYYVTLKNNKIFFQATDMKIDIGLYKQLPWTVVLHGVQFLRRSYICSVV